ncbi:hypothetical protein H7J93_11690 [Mycobacterium barrassiae]|nr:hypothetical protein [Mycobacterium barrassiae]
MRTVHRKAIAAAGLGALAMFGAVSCSSDSSTEAGSTTSAATEPASPVAAAPNATPMADP